MLTDYIKAAMRRARYKILPADGSFYGQIQGLEGIWAHADTLEVCRDELEDVLEEWIVLSLAKNLPIPTIDGLDLSVDGRTVAGVSSLGRNR
jgi:predicted RNase H-like HicB family nuclease